MAKAKKYTHVGNVNGDSYQHIVRLPCGRLTIVRHTRDVNEYTFMVDANCAISIQKHTGEIHVRCPSWTIMGVLQDHCELARFVHTHLMNLQPLGQGA